MTAPGPGGPAFTYEAGPVRVVFGAGVWTSLGDELGRMGARTALVVTTPGRAAALSEVLSQLGEAATEVFDGARPHVPLEVLGRALEAARRTGAGACVALGGGSAIGLAKAVALEAGLPILAVPTTYSGSEMTAVWGITEGDRKRTGRDPRVRPRTVVYDPLLTLGLPAGISTRSGMNAVAHCVEALYAVDGSPVATLLAQEGIRVLARSLTRVSAHPAEPGARGDALYGAHLAGWALDMASMGLHHKLCHVLGGTFGLPHATVHAVLLPYVAAYNASAAREAMDGVSRALGSLGIGGAPAGLFDLNRAIGIRETLRDLGLDRADLDRAAKLAVDGGYPNPRAVTPKGVRGILEAAWLGDRPSAPHPAS